MEKKLNDPKITKAWTMYDWANSVFSLTIATAIFPPYYETVSKAASVAQGNFLNGNYYLNIGPFKIVNSALYSYALSVGFLIITFLSPILSGVADAKQNKLSFMKFFCYLGSLSCVMMYFFTPENFYLGLALFILSLIGFGGSIVFYNAFLPEIASEDQFDELSARGFSMGYIGSVLLLILNLVLIMNPGWVFPLASKAEELMQAGFTAEEALQKAKDFYGLIAIKLSFVSVGIWWAGFAQITFNNLKEYPKKDQAEKQNYLKKGFHELQKVFKEIKQSKSGRFSNFLIGYFFASMGIQTVMYVASLFGSLELKMGTSELIVTILIIQLIAIVGAKLFAIISSKIGNIYSLLMMLLIWIGITIGAYFVQSSLQFYALAGVVGVVMGGIQSMFRSTFAKIIPEHTSDHASYFSFYDVCEKLATVLGTFVFAFINNMTGNMRSSVLVLMVFFLVGLFFISRIKNFTGKVASHGSPKS